MRLMLCAAAVTLLAGCASPVPNSPPPPREAINPPVCGNPTECERMWIAAQDELQTLTGLRLTIATDSRLETFSPSSRRPTAGSVVKYPLGEGRYEIRMRMACYYHDCASLIASGEDAFNSMVRLHADKPAQ